jgi:hypothetical protein
VKQTLIMDERPEAPIGISGPRVLNLNNVSSEISKNAAGDGPWHKTREVNNSHFLFHILNYNHDTE